MENNTVPQAQTQVNNSRVSKTLTSSGNGKYPQMAKFSDRFIAYLIDSFVVGIASAFLYGIITMMLLPIFAVSGAGSETALNSFGVMIQLLAWPASFLVPALYYGYLYPKKGQSIGKQVMELKVVRAADLQYLTVGQALVRDILGKWVSGFVFSLGYFWYFMSETRQAWHDSIAKTYVVKTNAKGDILMTDQANYPKEPVKTFAYCGCIVVPMALAIMGILAVIVLAAVNPQAQLEKARSVQSQYQYQYDSSKPLSGEGEMCGGLMAIECDEGLVCEYDGEYPNSSGICVRESLRL